MDNTVLYIIIGILLVIIIGLIYLLPVAKKKGANDIFALFLGSAFDERMKWFKTLNKVSKPGGSVFVGDSITNEYLLTEMLSEYNVHNRGIGGDTTDGVLSRMKESVYDVNPSKLFLLIGTNDLALTTSSDEEIANNIALICEKSIDYNHKLEINIISVLHVCDKVYPHVDPTTIKPRTNERIDNINNHLITLAKTKKYNYLDFNKLLSDESGSLHPDYTREGLHLSQKAYELLTEELKRYL